MAAAVLADAGGVESGWWQQTVTVGYEHAKGRRRTGQTADAGFQVGVQRVISLGRAALWELLTSTRGARIWLGGAPGKIAFKPGVHFETRDGGSWEVRTIKPGHRLRLIWRPGGRKGQTTLQITLSCPRNTRSRTTLRFHHEKLASAAERVRMRRHWQAAINELEALALR